MPSKHFLNNIKQRLLAEKEERLKRSAQKHDIDSDGDETDEIQANIQIDLHNQFAGLNKQKLLQIDEALERIEKKVYGLCVDCEEQIAEKRLLANPYYITCVSCAEEREVEEKHRKGF